MVIIFKIIFNLTRQANVRNTCFTWRLHDFSFILSIFNQNKILRFSSELIFFKQTLCVNRVKCFAFSVLALLWFDNSWIHVVCLITIRLTIRYFNTLTCTSIFFVERFVKELNESRIRLYIYSYTLKWLIHINVI